MCRNDENKIRRIESILRRIFNGEKVFKPEDDTPEALEKFQHIVKILSHCHDQGWLKSYNPHLNCTTAIKVYDLVSVFEGLSDAGNEYLNSAISQE